MCMCMCGLPLAVALKDNCYQCNDHSAFHVVEQFCLPRSAAAAAIKSKVVFVAHLKNIAKKKQKKNRPGHGPTHAHTHCLASFFLSCQGR